MANATGGTITTSGGYTIHTFTTNGTLIFPGSGKIDYLVVGGGASVGGGQAGSYFAGSGGGGEVLHGESQSLSPGSYSIVVGAATGLYNTGNDTGATDGNNSSFNSITGRGGKKGFGSSQGGANGDAVHTGGTGRNGGYAGGGGAGATANGANGSGNTFASGGAGYTSSISGSPVEYGRGGSSSFGTGSAGSGDTIAPYTGRGGGAEAGAGGTGVVIVRYLTGSLSSGNGLMMNML